MDFCGRSPASPIQNLNCKLPFGFGSQSFSRTSQEQWLRVAAKPRLTTCAAHAPKRSPISLSTITPKTWPHLTCAWAVEGDFDPATLSSNTFEMEWPPKSGRRKSFPEVDGAQWFAAELAKQKMLFGQPALVDELLTLLES